MAETTAHRGTALLEGLERLHRAAQGLWAGELRRPAPPVWYVRNETPRPIWLEHEGRVFTLAPLEKRLWTPGQDPRTEFPALRRLMERHQLAVLPHVEPSPDPAVRRALRALVVVGFCWLAAYWPLTSWWWQRIGALLGFAAALVFLLLLTRPGEGREGFGVVREGRQMARRTWNNAVMLMVLAVGVLMPASTLYFATDLHDVVSVGPTSLSVDTSRPLVLIGRLIQLVFIAVATLLPALMYFQFDAERLSTLRDRWMQNVFRLDPTVATVSDVTAKYGRQLEEAYGSLDEVRGRLTRGRRSPIVIATLVLAFGWLLILLRSDDRIEAAAAAPGGLSFVSLLDPEPSLVTYAFLGAYFFAVQLTWQGYVRADLRPKAYTTVSVRVLTVVVLAWLIDAALPAGQPAGMLYLLAFLAGIVPNTVLHFIVEKALGKRGPFRRDNLRPLTDLEGIDLYERTRLSEEGITSVEALAHHDLLDLFFKTRIPAARLLDWVDQAILAIYLGTDECPTGPVPTGAELRSALRAVGVRTATDLVHATRRAGACDGEDAAGRLTAAVASVLGRGGAEDREQLGLRLELISAALDHSEWIGRIEHWRRSDLIEADHAHRRYVDANGDLRDADPRLRRG